MNVDPPKMTERSGNEADAPDFIGDRDRLPIA